MTAFNRNRESRRQNALERLGINNPRCVICGEADWRVLECHHIAGCGFGEDTVIICRNCHRKLSDDQKDHPPKIGDPPSSQECMAHFFLGLADFLALLVEKLREFGHYLIDSVSKKDQSDGRRA